MMSSWSGITASSSSSSSSPLLKDDSKDVQDGAATGDASTLGEKSDELASAAVASDHPQRAKEESSLFFVDDLKKFIASELKDDPDVLTVESLMKRIPYFGQCDQVSRITEEFKLKFDRIQNARASLLSSNEELQNRHDSLVMGSSTTAMEIDDSLRESIQLDSETLESLNTMTPENRASMLRQFVKNELRLLQEKVRLLQEKVRLLQEKVRSRLLDCAADVESAATKANTTLLALSGLTQAEQTVSHTPAKYSEANAD